MALNAIMEKAAARTEAYVKSHGQFQATCDNVFAQLDYMGTGRVASSDAVAASGVFFEQLSESLADFGMAVEQPSEREVRSLLGGVGLAGQDWLNRDQFEALYLAVLKLAAGKCVQGFIRKYGTGIAVGTVGVFAAKRVVRSVPVVGLVASPFLMLLPTLIVGPVVGVVGVYCKDHGGVGALKDLWRSIRGRDGGFIAG